MGNTQHINADKFPKQGSWIGQRVRVCYDYNTTRAVEGVVIRDDTTEPGLMIIHTDDGRALLSTECQYSRIKQNT